METRTNVFEKGQKALNSLFGIGVYLKNSSIEAPEIKESIGGMILINTTDYNDAATIAKDCPILTLGGCVEIRKAMHSL